MGEVVQFDKYRKRDDLIYDFKIKTDEDLLFALNNLDRIVITIPEYEGLDDDISI